MLSRRHHELGWIFFGFSVMFRLPFFWVEGHYLNLGNFFLFSKEKKNLNFELRICLNIKMKKLCYFGLRDNYFFDLMNWAVGRFFKNRFT